MPCNQRPAGAGKGRKTDLNKCTVRTEAEKLLRETDGLEREEVKSRYQGRLSKDQIDRIYYHYCYLRERKKET